MTVTNQSSRTSVVGSGSTGQDVPFSFPIKATSDLTAFSRVTATGVETDLDETTNYTVEIDGDVGGTLTTVTAISSDDTIHLIRNTPLTQSLKLVIGGTFSSEDQEDAFDKNAKLAAENSDALDRSIHMPPTDAGLSMELPSSVDRASKVMSFDSNGAASAIDAVPEGSVAFSAFGKTLVAGSDAAATRNILGNVVSFDVDAFADFQAAITAIGSSASELHIHTAQAVGTDPTVPETLTLVFHRGGSLEIADGNTVTIEGHIQAGLYKIFTLDGTGKADFAAGDRVTEYYPQWWGAVSDAVTDDAPAIQAMFTSLSAGGLTVFPSGTYLIGSGVSLTVSDNTCIRMNLNTILLRDTDAAAPLLDLGNSCRVSGGEIRQNTAHINVSNANAGIRAQDKTDIWVEDLQVRGQFRVGIIFEGVTRGYVSNCHVRGVKNRCFYPFQVCIDIHYVGCLADGRNIDTDVVLSDYGYNVNPGGDGTAKNILFTNCIAKKCGLQGFEFGGDLVNSGASGCVAEDIGFHGFLVQLANTNTIEHVFLTGCKALRCDANGFLILDSNYVSLTSCIAQDGTSIVFSGIGIRLQGSKLCTVTGCVAEGNASSGFYLDRDVTPTVTCDRNVIVGCIGANNSVGLTIADSDVNKTHVTGSYFFGNSTEISDSGTATSLSNNGTT